MPNEQDIYLLDQLKAGDSEAFAYLYNKHRKWLAVAAVSILKDEADALDLIQDFFSDFWQKKLFLKIQAPYNIESYLHQCVRNRCLDRIRRRQVAKRRNNDLVEGMEEHYIPENRMETDERRQQLSNALEAAIQNVPAQSAKVFTLTYLQNKSRAEVASEMGISPNTVKNQLVRAIKILREKLKNI